MPKVPRLMIVAGSDSSGGAGLEADQKVAAAHGVYSMTATTALTAQNTQGIFDVLNTPAAFVKKQIDLCLADIGSDVLKTGMLATAETVSVVADAIKRHSIPYSVIDPVMVATTGAKLLPEDAIEVLLKELLPVASLLTPNIPEAELLVKHSGLTLDQQTSTVHSLLELAKEVQNLGPKSVLLKGGHFPIRDEDTGDLMIYNILVSEDEAPLVLKYPHQNSKNTHGTGCSLASAIASNVARGLPIKTAIKNALSYVDAGIRTSQELGKGSGPINHFHSLSFRAFSSGEFTAYLLDRDDVKKAWDSYTKHEFVRGLGHGDLPVSHFKSYLIQDYLFLIQFSRSNSLAAYKAKNPEDIQRSAAIVMHIYREMQLHIDYCAEYGLSKSDILAQDESLACVAYTRFVLDIGQSEDWLALQIAMYPCLLGYGAIAKRLYSDPTTFRDGNPYMKWIENYVAADYQEAVCLGSGTELKFLFNLLSDLVTELIEQHILDQSPARIEQLVRIFIQATKLEASFWDMGLAA
ncbi:hypothetical protein BT63DRAFT_396951 [Microthyrium microscopicum]|uniref:Uncharacterized protein n=1 Tax=Microthyrium microscopicum TaxID=703497 RepID=A0A6A6UP18_9PEZI|nr:hypothetical protein BT63DRAFT_396951 [Microthyrium microscopicum]